VVAVVAERSESVRRYVEERGLPFNILIDTEREVAHAYGVWQRFGLTAWNIARPALFLIDRQGRVRFRYVAARQNQFPTSTEVFEEIERLQIS